MPNLLPTDFVAAIRVAPTGDGAEAFLEARLALMSTLEASLHVSRKALLALDVAGLERETAAQVGLIHEFDMLRRCGTHAPTCANQTGGDMEFDSFAGKPSLEEKFRQSADRILEAARVQAALLKRARSKLRVLANMLAGPTVIYGPLGTRGDGSGHGTF